MGRWILDRWMGRWIGGWVGGGDGWASSLPPDGLRSQSRTCRPCRPRGEDRGGVLPVEPMHSFCWPFQGCIQICCGTNCSHLWAAFSSNMLMHSTDFRAEVHIQTRALLLGLPSGMPRIPLTSMLHHASPPATPVDLLHHEFVRVRHRCVNSSLRQASSPKGPGRRVASVSGHGMGRSVSHGATSS